MAATGPNDELARFSNFGATSVDLAAPGIGVLSTLPGGRYGTANGTSMAAPHVAGTAALIWSEVPDATLAEVRQAILDGVDPLTELSGLTVTGGRLNAAGPGFGRLCPAGDAGQRAEHHDGGRLRQSDHGALSRPPGDRRDQPGRRRPVGDASMGPKDQLPTTLVPGSVSWSDGDRR